MPEDNKKKEEELLDTSDTSDANKPKNQKSYFYFNIVATLVLIGFTIAHTIPKTLKSVGIIGEASKTFPAQTIASTPQIAATQVVLPNLASSNLPTHFQIDAILPVVLKTGEIGTIKYIAYVEANASETSIYQIIISSNIQDLVSKSSFVELINQPALFNLKLKKTLPKNIKNIYIEPSLDLLKTKKTSFSIGDPLKF
jgi:hypothetical protein